MQLIDLYPDRIPAWFNLELYTAAAKLTESEWRGNLGFRRSLNYRISVVEESTDRINKLLKKELFTAKEQGILASLVEVNDRFEKIQQHPVLIHEPGYQPDYYSGVSRVSLYDAAIMHALLSECLANDEGSGFTEDQKRAFSDLRNNIFDDNYADDQIEIGDRLSEYYEEVLGDDSSVLLSIDLSCDKEEDEILEEFRSILRDLRGQPRKKRWCKHDTARFHQNMILPILDLYLIERWANMITVNEVLLRMHIAHCLGLEADDDIQDVLNDIEPSKYTASDYKRVLGLNVDDNTMLKRVKAAKQWMADFGRMPNIHHIKSQGN